LRSYEAIFILDPGLGDEAVESAIAAASEVVRAAGGQVPEVQKWGKKRLAYEIKKRREGHYVYLKLQAPARAVVELERHLKIAESVLKYLTVLMESPRRPVGKGKPKRSAVGPAEPTIQASSPGIQEA
jgi:small subunit ribosomal protein S6